MKNCIPLTLISLLFFFACNQASQEATQEAEVTAEQTTSPLEGTWKLTQARWASQNTYDPADSIDVIKTFTGDHYFFIYYNRVNGAVDGIGGGELAIEDSSFTEHPWYYSWDSTLIQTSPSFSFKLEDGKLIQTGKLDSESYQDYEIYEEYQKIEDGISSQAASNPILGVWKLDAAKYGDTTAATTASELMGGGLTAYKLFTPGYFYAVVFNGETGKPRGVSFGSVQYSGSTIRETLLSSSWSQASTGETYTYQVIVSDDTLLQSGFMGTEETPENALEETWVKVE